MNSPLALSEFSFQKTMLPNGLDVIVRRQDHLPLVAANLWYHVGSKNEERRQRGFAHLFEHLMFEGSEHYPGDFFKPLQRLGASVNGSTSADRTNYFVDTPSAHLELVLAMESDRMGHLLPALTDHKLRVQKDVVKNEYRQNYANRPYGQVSRILAEALYTPEHPYSWLTIGAMEDVEAASRDDVEAFFRRFYVPSNASLCMVGDVDPEAGFALAERYFGGLPGGAKALRPWVHEAELAADLDIRVHDRVELDRVYLVWHTVPQFHADDAALVLLADILARHKSSRLYRKLVMEEGLAQDVSAYQSGRELAGTFGLTITMRPGQSWQRALELADAELAALAARGPDEAERERVLNGRLAGFVYALGNIGGFGGVADRLNAYNVYLGDPGRVTSDLQRYQAVTSEEIARVARGYIDTRPRVRLAVLGRGGSEPAALDRTQAPATAPAPAFSAPSPEVRSLSDGSVVWVLPKHDLPVVAATVVLRAGAGTHGPEVGGLASLASSMLDEGTATRSSVELALAAESMGTSLSTSCGWDGAYVGLQCLTPHLGKSLELAVDILCRPSFPQDDWNRIHAQTLARLQAQHDSAESRAYRGVLRALYPAGHSYRTPIDGHERTVGRLTREAARSFYESRYRPGCAAWVFAGDVEADRVVELLEAQLAGWTGQAPELAPIARPALSAGPRIILVDRPDAAQAVIRAGHVGLDRLHADYTSSLVLNQVLGGQFTSRLNAKLREEKGFTYGVRSHFDFRRGAGPFLVSTAVQTDKAADAVAEILLELQDLVGERPPTLRELDDARRALLEGQARHFETPSALVSRYGGLLLYDLPADYHAHYAERLAGVSVESLLSAAQRHIRPQEVVAVVVADASLVAGPLERLGWAGFDIIRHDDMLEP